MSFADRMKALVGHPKANKGPTPRVATVTLVDFKSNDVRVEKGVIEDAPVDIGKLVRRAVRARRAGCGHKWVAKKNGVEVCELCRDSFPCSGDRCHHLDCIVRGFKLGRRAGFPRDMPFSITVLADGHRPGDECLGCVLHPDDHYEYAVDVDEPPEKWITKIPLEPR